MEQRVYSEMFNLEGKHWWFVARRAYLKQVISKFYKDKRGLQFCEIGSGTGGNLKMLSEYAVVDSVEMNDESRQYIVDKNLPGVRYVSAGHLPYDLPYNDHYDGVFLLDVLEHVEDDRAALREIKSLMKEDTYLTLTVPAYQWLWSEHDVVNHHHRRYTRKKLSQMVTQEGYEICYSSYFNSILFPLAAINRVTNKFRKNAEVKNTTLSMPKPIVNSIFQRLFEMEKLFPTQCSVPFGLSIIVVAKKV